MLWIHILLMELFMIGKKHTFAPKEWQYFNLLLEEELDTRLMWNVCLVFLLFVRYASCDHVCRAGGVANLSYCFCVELWGGTLSTSQNSDQYHDGNTNDLTCFEQFNPIPSQLADDLWNMHVFYEQFLLQVVGQYFPFVHGVTFHQETYHPRPTSFSTTVSQSNVSLPQWKFDSMKQVCSIQQQLYKTQWPLQQLTPNDSWKTW